MKKGFLFILFMTALISCRDEYIPLQKTVENDEEVIEDFVEEKIDYLDSKDIKILINESNKETNIIEVDILHEIIIEDLLLVIDFEDELENQEYLIEETTRRVLEDWKREIVKEVVLKNGVSLNNDDFETVVMRTSIKGALQIMTAYEKIYLRKYYR